MPNENETTRRPFIKPVRLVKLPRHGAVAQLGERCVRNAEVGSSILLRSTISYFPKGRFAPAFWLATSLWFAPPGRAKARQILFLTKFCFCLPSAIPQVFR